ncbi:MAG: gliding motility-associated C-terminal domain-containing protein [Flavobacteriales bacterium]|nr:gliding motility-associated C-terminal domain-containing protein [Flavobacteriales bacterium]
MSLRTLCSRIAFVLLTYAGAFNAAAQPGIIPTLGKEFWVGFMFNPPTNNPVMNIFISSDVNTTGNVQVPGLGIDIPFTVIANVTTTVSLDADDVMHTTASEIVDNKAVLITTADTVAVFAINFQPYSADAAVIYPYRSLGIEYRIFSHRGLEFGGTNDYASEFLIVSPQDGTEVEITTSCATQGGHAAGVPWIVQLDSGETYQVKAVDGVQDLTGSTIVGTPQSGTCRPFAVFSGSSCARVPEPCTACDHIVAQNLPRNVWGLTYHSVPFETTTGYTYRLMSDIDGTLITVDGAAPILLNAGEWTNVYNEANAVCFSGNQRFAVAQYMQGVTCSDNGDPALLILNAEEQRINSVTFATVVSNVITDHYLNVVTNTSDIGFLTLDGAPVPPAAFSAYPACPSVSHASLLITEGSHTLLSPGGFSAYAYGMGNAESYAYSVGSYSDEPQLPVDSVLCGLDSTGNLTLTAPSYIFNPYWTLYADPDDTLHLGQQYTFVPPGSDIYSVTGNEFISGCESQFLYSVEVADPPALDVTADGDVTVSVCAYEPVQLNVVPDPGGTYLYTWWPAATLSASNIPNPIATPAATTWYYSSVSTLNGCAVALDSVLVTVVNGDVMVHEATPANTLLCLGDSVQFELNTRQVVGEDLLNGSIGALWQNVAGGVLDDICGAVDGDALYFNGAAPRTATTVPLNVPNGGTVRFGLKVANAAAPCDDAEVGDNIVLEYSLTGGAPWTAITTYLEFNFADMTMVDAEIPAGAFSPNTSFRWTQVGAFAAGEDNWVLDQVTIAAVDPSGLSFNWTPAGTLEDATIADPWAYPTVTGWYYINTTDDATSCLYTDSVYVDVGEPFSIAVTPDTVLCDVAGIQLDAAPSSGTGHVWAWSPGATLNADFVQSPTATPATTTTYSVTVTTAQGCSAEEEVTITVAQLLDLEVTVDDNSICAGETVNLLGDLDGSGLNVVRTWFPAGSVDSPNTAATTASPTNNTMFVHLVVDTLTGCALSDSVLVSVSNLYQATATNDTTVCTAVGLDLGVVHNVPAPALIAWSPAVHLTGANTATPAVQLDSTMVYAVQVTGPDGCAAYDTTVVTVAFSDLMILSDTAFCAGGSATLDAGFPLASHSWNTGANTQVITVDTTGLYTVTLTDATGCTRQHTTDVTVHPLPVVDIGVDPGLCDGDEWILDAGNPAADHEWTTAEQTQTITVTLDGMYGVLVTDGFGCQNSDSVLLEFHPLPVVELRDTTVCVSETISFDAGNEGSTYLWSTGETTRTIAMSELTGIINVVVTTAENCVDSASAYIDFIPFPLLDLGPDTALCDTEMITFDAGGPGVTYLWSTGSTDQYAAFVDDALVWASVFNGYCTSTDTVDVVFNPLPLPALDPSVVTCLDEPPHFTILDAENPDCTYLWNTGETTQVIQAKYYQPYTVIITTPLNCSIEETILVEEYCRSTLYLPNSFTPDGDGVNELFFPTGNNIASMKLAIFDRWGELIYEGEDADAFWNGKYNGDVVKQDVYVWKVTYRFFEDVTRTVLSPEKEMIGHVTVLP